MRNYAKVVGVLSILALGSIGNLAAQDDSVSRAQRAVQRLSPGSELRVRAPNKVVEGLFQGTSAEGVILARDGGGTAPIPFTTIEEMWKRGRAAGTGALIGAGIGAAVVGGFGVFLAGALCENSNGCGGDQVGVGLTGAAIGGVGGGLIGAIVGAAVTRWVRIYP